jgi:hypothetical protein
LLCAFIPDAPSTVTTANSVDQVLIQWSDPITNGSPITGYKIYVKHEADATYTQESVECDGTSSTVINDRECQISLVTLRAAPYSLVLGSSVSVKVESVNVYGDSAQSAAGSGAAIQLVPDAPIDLTNDATTTSDTVIRFTWTEGVSNGDTPVIDYAVYYDQGTGDFVELDSAVTQTEYVLSSITPGVTYSFMVTARNTVGSSLNSDALSILGAKVPDSPVNLANVPVITTGYQIGLIWEDGAYDGGSPIIDYQLIYALESGSYTEYASGITTQSLTVTGLTPGSTYNFQVRAQNLNGYSDYSTLATILAA